MSWMNRQVPAALVFPISSVAKNAETEKSLSELSNRIEIVTAQFTNNTEIVTSAAAGFVLALINEGTTGTLGRTVTSYAATAGATLGATQSIALTASTTTWTDSQTLTRRATEIEGGEVLAWKEATIGTGTERSDGHVTIEYIIL